MILVHANPFDHRLWMYQVARFSSRYTVITMDIRGYGRSEQVENPFSLDDMADDALAVCADLGITSAIVGGCSVGSGVALLIGQRNPDFAKAVVLVGGSSKGGRAQPRIDGYRGEAFVDYRRSHTIECLAPGFADTERGAWIVDLFSDTSNALSGLSISRNFEARRDCDLSAGLADMRMPVLVINGEHDNSLEAGRATAAGIPGARHAIIAATGHACCIENPEAFEQPMISFLKENSLWPELSIG